MPTFKKIIGSKLEVWNGTAEKTAYGDKGLFKKDLKRIKRGDQFRIVSKKQHMNMKKKTNPLLLWSKSVKKARKFLIKEGIMEEGEFVPILKSSSKKYNKSINDKGKKLYKKSKEIYDKIT